mmetsp:Transcript_17038/g.19646  ORF Transcript_17038/g.19646 Transcript_17038/m.19646 type:complete len:181 (-) Transcript_17038:667-1209(-)
MTPFIDSIADAELDINEDTLMFKVPDIYDLMIKFKYRVDPDKGSAKFEKDKKVLVINLPIIGVTEATHEFMRREKENFDKNMKRIAGQLVQDLDNYEESVNTFEINDDLEHDIADANKLQEEITEDKEELEAQQPGILNIYDESKNSAVLSEAPKVIEEIKFKEESDSAEIRNLSDENKE